MRSTPILAAMLALAILFSGLHPPRAAAQDAPVEEGLLVIYGSGAPSREGDIDRREQIFFSVPAEAEGRFHVRLFDPEIFGTSDFIYGGTGNAETTFRVFGGSGAFSEAERPRMVADGERGDDRDRPDGPVSGPGTLIHERPFGNARETDGRWVTLGSVRARQGEVIGERAWFRLDIQGTGGDDGNGYSVAVSTARERNLPPDGLEMISYRPTVRWPGRGPATQVWFTRRSEGPFTVQNFDVANGTLTLSTAYEDLPIRPSGQDIWASDTVDSNETNLAFSLIGGFERPNDVTLQVFDGAGEAVGLTMPPRRAPEPPRPTAVATARPLADCSSVAFDGSGSTGGAVLSHLWQFGDGASSSERAVVHRYAAPGRYEAELFVLEEGTRPARGDSIRVPVHVRRAPVALPGEAILVAPGDPLRFDGSGSIASDSPIARYLWSFGDGSTAEGATVEKTYTQPGSYLAVLRVEDDADHPCNFGQATRPVEVNFAPVAEAGRDQDSFVGAQVLVSAQASYDLDGLIEAYLWDMGDGTILEGANVAHTYREPGSYRVALTVRDDSGVANDTARDHMIVFVNAPPRPAIAEQPRPLAVGERGQLDGTASLDPDGTILSYVWDFGDGARGEGAVVDYAWAEPGIYDVSLTVTDDSGTGSAVQSTQTQVVVSAAPVAEAGADQFVTASEVLLDGSGSVDPDGEIARFQWDLGDGSFAEGRRVRHAYARPGTYRVALVVTDDSGAPLNTDRDVLEVTINATPIADAGPVLTVAPGQEFVLDGGGSVDPDGSVSAWTWTLPGGATLEGERVALSFDEPGLKRVLLTVADDFAGGAAVDEDDVLITVNERPVAVAGPDLLVEPGQTIRFDGRGSFDRDGAVTSWRWEFDDLAAPIVADVVERAFEVPGVYSAQLIVSDDSGVLNATAVDDTVIRVNHAPVAEAGPEIETDRLFVALDASASSDADGDALIYRWDMGDGSAPVFGARVTHVFPRSGVYPVTLRVDDGTGLGNATAVDATVVSIAARPVADAGGNRDVCSGDNILFDASGSLDPDGGLLLYRWDFGDGTSSDIINPNKTYERPGTYPVTLTVRNETGTDRGVDIDRIAAIVREGPIADAGADRTVCTNQQIRFDGSASTDADGAVNAFSWTFGDGGSGSGETPTHVFQRPGAYTVTLSITGDARGACSPVDTDTAEITVVAAPELAILGEDRAAAGLPAAFRAGLSDAGGARPVGYSWDFGDGTTATGAEVEHVFAEPGIYTITLRTDLAGGNAECSTLETVRRVIVNDAPVAAIEGPEVVAVGEAVVFDGGGSADSDGALTAFAWNFGDGNTARGVLGAHRYERAGTYELSLAVTDDAGVGNSTAVAVRRITVNPPPTAGLEAPPPVCPGATVPFSVTSVSGSDVAWSFGDGAGARGPETSHAYSEPGLYPVTVTLDDGRGQANSVRSEEVYVRVNSAPTALAGPDRTVCPGDTVEFDASRSSDLDGEIVEWLWQFSDGTVLSGPTVSRSFDRPGMEEVRLTVRDDSGARCAIGTDSARVLVNSAPSVDAGPAFVTKIGGAHDVVRFDASGASDPDGHGLRLTWDFGDGTTATGAVVRHRYTSRGEFLVTVTAEDETGLSCGVASDMTAVAAVPRE